MMKHLGNGNSKELLPTPKPEEIRERNGFWNLERAGAGVVTVELAFHQELLPSREEHCQHTA